MSKGFKGFADTIKAKYEKIKATEIKKIIDAKKKEHRETPVGKCPCCSIRQPIRQSGGKCSKSGINLVWMSYEEDGQSLQRLIESVKVR